MEQGLIVVLVMGAISGWLAGKILRHTSYGLTGDVIVGIIGSYFGSWVWDILRLPPIGDAWINTFASSAVGAAVLLVLLRVIKR